jgi:hypothetical protein
MQCWPLDGGVLTVELHHFKLLGVSDVVGARERQGHIEHPAKSQKAFFSNMHHTEIILILQNHKKHFSQICITKKLSSSCSFSLSSTLLYNL